MARMANGCKFDFVYRLIGQVPNEQVDFRIDPEQYGCPKKVSLIMLVCVSIAIPIVIGLVIMIIIKLCIYEIQKKELREFEDTIQRPNTANYVTENPLYREYRLREETTHNPNLPRHLSPQ